MSPASRLGLAAVIGSLALAGCARGEARKVPAAGKFVGEEAAAILKDARTVEVFRVSSVRQEDAAGKAIEGFPVTARGKDQDRAFATRLAAILLDDGTYSPDSAKGCIFQPGVVFRVPGGKGRGSLDVILCYSCTELKIVVRDADGRAIRKAGEDFDNARPALVALAKAAFPDDAAIQALPK